MTHPAGELHESLATCCYDTVQGWIEPPPEADFPKAWERNLIESGFQEAIDQAGGQFLLGDRQRLRVHYDIEQTDAQVAGDFRRELVLALIELLGTEQESVERSVFRHFFLVVSVDQEQTQPIDSPALSVSPSAETSDDQSPLDTQAEPAATSGLAAYHSWLTQPLDAFRGQPQAVEALRLLRASREELRTAVLPRFQVLLDSLAGQSFESPDVGLELVRIINQERAAFQFLLRVKGADPLPVYLNANLAPRAKRVTFQVLSADRKRRSIVAKTTFPPLEAYLPEREPDSGATTEPAAAEKNTAEKNAAAPPD